MEEIHAKMKMPELFVFVKTMALGFVLTEIFYVMEIGGRGLAPMFVDFSLFFQLAILTIVLSILIRYVFLRGGLIYIEKIHQSKRVDLLFLFILGVVANNLSSPFTKQFHESIGKIDPRWTLFLAVFFLTTIVSSLIRTSRSRSNENQNQLYFLTDNEVQGENDDVLGYRGLAQKFAETVLVSGSTSGLVYGIDAPWGTGKSSFINLASSYWLNVSEVILFRFEPLRYASDPDLAERFIRDLSVEIQRQVFAPEFQPIANRYSRMLKGKTDFSFLGFKFTLEPSSETIDELLEDIDSVLKRIGRRLIVVIDDLDRLDAKSINNVLFTVQRTFKLTQAAYVLCYDTENLVANKDETERARQFLEKFINVKLSLFVDGSALRNFLTKDWNKEVSKFSSIPSDSMYKLAAILSELANLIEDKESAAKYAPLVGNMRKLKRFVNALLMMQFDKVNFTQTDFNLRDLINLTLLHLNYPGVFRHIYAEESEGRSGIFSIKVDYDNPSSNYINAEGFSKFVELLRGPERFLLDQLFDTESLKLGNPRAVNESVWATRACFNAMPRRNLENYLKLIVRFERPKARDTFKLYQVAVSKVIAGEAVEDVLSGLRFDLKNGEQAHDEFWRILINHSFDFNARTAEDAINTLVNFLPRYSSVHIEDRGLRARSIFSLIMLLDRAGWGRTANKRRTNTPENIVEITHWIYGEGKYSGRGLIERLAAEDRGVLGLYDLVLFRLQCSQDRQGQLHNLHSALILHDDVSAPTTGLVSGLAINGMRTISQRVFALFKARYIDAQRNLFDDVSEVPHAAFFGVQAESRFSEARKNGAEEKLLDSIEGTRSMTKTFIVYQLANRLPGTGAGVGTGYYNTVGTADNGEIAACMNDYLFDFCFDPTIKQKNAEHFLDYCLCNLTSNRLSFDDEDGYRPTSQGLTNALDVERLVRYWLKHGKSIKAGNFTLRDRRVVTLNYIATYREDLPFVFEVLDQIKNSQDTQSKKQ